MYAKFHENLKGYGLELSFFGWFDMEWPFRQIIVSRLYLHKKGSCLLAGQACLNT